MFFLLCLSFWVAMFTGLIVVRRARGHARRYSEAMPQRFHVGDVPRLGGVAIFVGLFIAWSVAILIFFLENYGNLGIDARMVGAWTAALLPALVGGIAEDFTQRLSVRYRLGLTALSGVFALCLVGASVPRLGVPGIDQVLIAVPWLGMVLALMAVMGLPHAFNIIDGYNGLSGMVALIVSLSLIYVSLQVGDRQLAGMLVCLTGATAGSDLELPAGNAVCWRWWGLPVGCRDCPGEHRAGAKTRPGLALVSHAVVDLPRVGNPFLHLSEINTRHVPWGGGRLALSSTDLPAHRARCFPRRRIAPRPDAQQPHFALPVGLYLADRGACCAVLAQHRGADGVLRAVRHRLCFGLPDDHPLQGTALAAKVAH